MNRSSNRLRIIGLTIATLFLGNGFPENSYASEAVVATPSFSIPFVSNTRGRYSYGLNFGIHASATKGIDPAVGEVEYPLFPPAGGLTMFSTVDGNTMLDLRGYTGPTQIDTYRIGFAAGDAYPMSFSWPDLTPYYNGSVRLKSDIDGSLFNIDMKAQTSYTMSTGPTGDFVVVYLYIIAAGPQAGTSLPVVSTFGYGSANFVTGFQAIVNAPAGATTLPNSAFGVVTGTTTWFEYGPTKSYGNSTTPQLVSGGSSMNVSSPFDPGSLPPDSRIHFRAVAQNSHGPSLGGDRILSNGNPPPEAPEGPDTVKYRTATYRDWADAKDLKNKRKSIKCKPDKVEFKLNLKHNWQDNITFTNLQLTFNMPTDIIGVWASVNGKAEDISDTCAIVGHDDKFKVWNFDFNRCAVLPPGTDTVFQFDGIGRKGSKLKVTYKWTTKGPTPPAGAVKGTLPGKPSLFSPRDTLKQQLDLPMPNLHNVGEDIYGGVKQTAVNITVATTSLPLGAHTVYHPKYKDVQKSLVKEQRSGNLYHTALPHCLNTFDKDPHKEILKRQKSLPPDKHNNVLFAEQLVLKLNIAASDSGLFPSGLGDLIYDNGGVKGLSGPFDGKTLRAIADSVDKYLGCNGEVAGTDDSTEFLKVDSLINAAFSGPMDTISWSCGKVVCTGVRMLGDVPYLHSNPSSQPRVDFGRVRGTPLSSQPMEFRLDQNYPNPFNPTTVISFRLPVTSFVTLKVYNILGEELVELIQNELMDEGDQEVEFDASNLPSGVYFYRIEAQTVSDDESGALGQKFTSVKKMVLTK